MQTASWNPKFDYYKDAIVAMNYVEKWILTMEIYKSCPGKVTEIVNLRKNVAEIKWKLKTVTEWFWKGNGNQNLFQLSTTNLGGGEGLWPNRWRVCV